MSASCSAVKKLSGVAVPSCSWGSSQRDAKPACQARTSLPLAAAPAVDGNGMTADATASRVRTTASRRIMSRPPLEDRSHRRKECRRLARGSEAVKSCDLPTAVASLAKNGALRVTLEAQPPVLVPHLDDARLALVAKDAQRRRVQRQAPPVDRRQRDPA